MPAVASVTLRKQRRPSATKSARKAVAYDLAEHRHRFAAWAAARAAQRGFTDVGILRAALDASGIRAAVDRPATFQTTSAQFDRLHRRWCQAICHELRARKVAKVTYGRAAKLVAIYLKARVIMGDGCDTPLGRTLHPPIDRVLLQALAKSSRATSSQRAKWRKLNWTQVDDAQYYDLIQELRGVLAPGVPFWQLEEFWQPSKLSDEM